jgi:hypothetical protein
MSSSAEHQLIIFHPTSPGQTRRQDKITTTPDLTSDPTILPCSSSARPLQYRRHVSPHAKPSRQLDLPITHPTRQLRRLVDASTTVPAPDMNAHLPSFPKQPPCCRAAATDRRLIDKPKTSECVHSSKCHMEPSRYVPSQRRDNHVPLHFYLSFGAILPKSLLSCQQSVMPWWFELGMLCRHLALTLCKRKIVVWWLAFPRIPLGSHSCTSGVRADGDR